jgi:hypothetical protein
MNKLRGTGNTFSTSGKRWLPFGFDPAHAAKQARLHRLKRKGLTPPTDKASLRQAAEDAVLQHGQNFQNDDAADGTKLPNTR